MDQALKKAANFEGIKGDNQNIIEWQRQTSALPLVKVPRNPMRNTHDGRAHKQTFFTCYLVLLLSLLPACSLSSYIQWQRPGVPTLKCCRPQAYICMHMYITSTTLLIGILIRKIFKKSVTCNFNRIPNLVCCSSWFYIKVI